MYLYRAVDKAGKTVDFYLSRHRDVAAAKAFLRKAMRHSALRPKSRWMPMPLLTAPWQQCQKSGEPPSPREVPLRNSFLHRSQEGLLLAKPHK